MRRRLIQCFAGMPADQAMNEPSPTITILPETADDAQAIERLNERTFGPGRLAKTAYRIREGAAHSLDLSFTARVGTLLVGSVRLTEVRIGDAAALLLGPLTIEPPFRDRGVFRGAGDYALLCCAVDRADGDSGRDDCLETSVQPAGGGAREGRLFAHHDPCPGYRDDGGRHLRARRLCDDRISGGGRRERDHSRRDRALLLCFGHPSERAIIGFVFLGQR